MAMFSRGLRNMVCDCYGLIRGVSLNQSMMWCASLGQRSRSGTLNVGTGTRNLSLTRCHMALACQGYSQSTPRTGHQYNEIRTSFAPLVPRVSRKLAWYHSAHLRRKGSKIWIYRAVPSSEAARERAITGKKMVTD